MLEIDNYKNVLSKLAISFFNYSLYSLYHTKIDSVSAITLNFTYILWFAIMFLNRLLNNRPTVFSIFPEIKNKGLASFDSKL